GNHRLHSGHAISMSGDDTSMQFPPHPPPPQCLLLSLPPVSLPHPQVVTTDFTPRHANSHFPLAPSSHSPIPFYPFLPSCLFNLQVVITDFTPRHANSMSGEGTTNPSPSNSSPSSSSAPFLELIAEWLLLASSHFFIIPNSGFSRTALLYSMHPAGSAFMPPDNCFPDVPVSLTWLGTTWSRV
ncbi:unnamed protein product, partial [Closterium sp. NIES-64]